jgi:cysteinyl-tRNA synthetase
LEKFQGIAKLPPIPVALADKYSKFGEDGLPTADKDGNPLDDKALSKAKKDVDKAAKVRAPLEKKLQEEPQFMAKLQEEVERLTAEVAAM